MIDVLLINPPNRLDQYGSNKEMVPLGLLSIAAVLESQGYDVQILDLEFADADVAAAIGANRPRLVGITGTSVARFDAFEIARLVKRIDPTITTIYGGPHASFTAQDTLQHVPEIDVIVRGEGEMTMLELMQCQIAPHDLARVNGISYRENNRVCHTAPHPRIRDLDVLPFPARHLLDMRQYTLKLDLLGHKAASIITSRGCPVQCSFCSASAVFGRTVTRRSARAVVDEIEHLLRHEGVDGIKFFDSTFTLVPGHADSICNEILRRGLSFPWECEIRVNTVNLPLLQKMKSAGCYLVDFGVESASERVIKRMHKGITLPQVEQVLRWTRDVGISQKAFFTIGHIEETVEDADKTLEFIHKNLNRVAIPSVGVGIRVYPGTEVEAYVLTNHLLPGFSWSKPYHEARNSWLNYPSNIPLLIQPQLGYSELVSIKRHVLELQSSSAHFILRRLRKSHSPADLRRYARSAGKLIRLKVTR